ncbi:MAG: homoserine dehydrogenase, partial [Alphaproteobacteria bacterium]|nr:homoserine dehydrogenase [Alphaproteobacteria bacterium]
MIARVSPLLADLTRREAEGRPVSIGVVGAGQMGTDLAVQIARIPGMRLGGIAVRNIGNAIDMAVSVGHRRDRVVTAKTSSAIDSAIERG